MHRSAVVFVVLAPIAACATAVSTTTRGTPAAPAPIAADELRRDLFAFADDSMAGRETGTPNELRAARFLARRLASLGVEPAGDSLYLQRIPLVKATFSAQTRFGVTQGANTIPLALGGDVVPLVNLGPGAPLPRRNAEGDVFFAGYGMTTQGRNDFQGLSEAGKVVVMLHGAPASVTDAKARESLESQDEIGQRIGRALQFQPAAVILLMTGKATQFYEKAAPELLRTVLRSPGDQSTSDQQRPLPMVLLGLAKAGSPLLPANWQASDAPQALAGRRFSGRVDILQVPFTGYNVVGVVRGSDPRWNKTYVAFGAHFDHSGIIRGSADTIANGADDDASGSVALLGIARSLMNARPKRSTIFVWHGAEEKGLLGSSYFTDHPTVPIDSIVAQLNLDMIGRRGGPNSDFDSRVNGTAAANRLYVVGPGAAPNNQSRALGAILDSVNARQNPPLQLDREWDTATHPERIYFRSDHYNYAQKGIPVLFFTTGLHEDYHKVSDEPRKIDFEKMARISTMLVQLGATIANRETRPK